VLRRRPFVRIRLARTDYRHGTLGLRDSWVCATPRVHGRLTCVILSVIRQFGSSRGFMVKGSILRKMVFLRF
jgi:hypothetical protein